MLTGHPRAKCFFSLGSHKRKYTSLIWFEGSFEILRCGHFDYWNQFSWIAYCAPSIGPDVNQHLFQIFFFSHFFKILIFLHLILSFSSVKKIRNNIHFTYWVICLASGTSVASMTSTASTTSVASMTSTASFHQKNYWAWCFHQPWHQNDLFWSLNVEWILKNPLFYWFLAPFLLEALEGVQHQKNKNWWIRHECPYLMNM